MTCKPRQIVGSEPIAAISRDYNRYGDRIVGDADAILNPEISVFVDRVLADGGTVEDATFLNSFVTHAKNNGYYDDIVAAYSPSWGVKGTTTASKLYCIKGATADLTQVVGANQPAINTNDLNGKTRILANGTSNFMQSGAFTLDQPHTNIFMGVEQESWTNNDHLCSGLNAGAGVVFQFTATPDLYLFSGTVSSSNSDATLATPAHLRALFNGASSVSQVDNNAGVSSDAGVAGTGGFSLFSDHTGGTKWINASVGAVVLLNSAVDANYAAKMAAIKAFSASAYGTP